MLNILRHFKLFIFIFVLLIDRCKQNSTNALITEYFLYRSPSTVVGFQCDSYESNVELIKKFNNKKLPSAIWSIENHVNLSVLAKEIYFKIGIFIDMRCQSLENIESLFNEASNQKMFGELHYWLVLGSNLNESLSVINDDSFGLSTDFVLAIFDDNQYIFYDIYNPCKLRDGTLKISQWAFWNEDAGFNALGEFNKLRRWNLEGMTLKIGAMVRHKPRHMPIIDYLENYNFREFDRITRLGYIMWKHVSTMFNFTLDFFEITASNDDDKSSYAIINALIKDEIDASGTADMMRSQQINILRAVYSAIPFRTSFIFRSTSSDQISIRDIFLPLSSSVWYLTIGLSVLSINALAFLLLFTTNDFYETYVRSIIIHVAAFCQQGTEFSADNLSGRIAILHILLFNLLLYNYYLASAVSNRLSEQLVLMNDSLHELRKRDFQYASEPMPQFNDYIENNDWETKSFYVHKWLKIPESHRFLPSAEGMSLVMDGSFAYHTYPDISYPYINRYFDDRKICELQEIHLVKPQQLSLFVQANSSFTEMLKNGFTKLTEVGIRDRQLKQWSPRKPKCRTDILTADSVKIKEVVPAIIFLLISMLISMAVLTFEFVFFVYYKRSIDVRVYFNRINKIAKEEN